MTNPVMHFPQPVEHNLQNTIKYYNIIDLCMSVVCCHLHGPSLFTGEFVPSALIVVAFGIALPAAETAIAASFVALFIESHSQ